MAPSLTSVLPALAPTFGLTPQALYERKRALIKLGLLPSPQGRGRRGGAAAGPDTVALLLIAVMVTDNLSEMDKRVRQLASAKLNGHGRCRITGAATFHEATAYLLSDQAPVSKDTDTLLEIRVSRAEPTASIIYYAWPGVRDTLHTSFGPISDIREDVLSVSSELRHTAYLSVRDVVLAATTGAT